MQDSQRDDYGYQNENNNHKSSLFGNLNKGQKITATSLLVFAFFILIFWALQFQKTLSTPFDVSGNQSGNTTSDTLLDNGQQDALLKAKDTDKDGLSDWDELNRYKTSPYLSDSDSDGFDDKLEIDNNKDPNCPGERDCKNFGTVDGDASLTTAGTSTSDSLPQYLSDQLGSQNAQNQGQQADISKLSDSEVLNQIVNGTIAPATLRQLLIDRGVDKNTLDKISDEQLLNNLRQTVNNSTSSGSPAQ